MEKKKSGYIFMFFLSIILIIALKNYFFPIESNINYIDITYYHPKEIMKENDINITAVGDVLLHSPIYNAARTKNGYDFTPYFKKIKDIFKYSEVSIANIESMPAGESYRPLSSYPTFNSPKEIVPNLIDSNFNIFTFGNNHVLDTGAQGYNIVLNDLNSYENIIHVGLNSSASDQRRIRYYEEDGIKIAILAYTTLTNGIKPPNGDYFMVNYSVYHGQWYSGSLLEKELKQDITTAKKNADIVVVVYHHGTYGENQDTYHPFQAEHTKWFAEQNVDVFFGGGAHVIQPLDVVKRKDGKDMYVTYSLGNFISNQYVLGYKYAIGLIGGIEVRKTHYRDGTSFTELYNPYVVPTYVGSGFVVSPWGEDFPNIYKQWTKNVLTRNTDAFTFYTKEEYLNYFSNKKNTSD